MTEDESIKKVTEDIRSGIDLLRKNGRLDLLKDMFGDELRDIAYNKKAASDFPMGIAVTDSMHIIIPQMNNIEVKMPTLARALYIFYLIHKEGVAYKRLVDYRQQLYDIYRITSNRSDKEKLNATINRLVNPLDNKVNECASRIKDAFTKIFNDNTAELYYLTSDMEHPASTYTKTIRLPRELVSLPDSLLTLTD